MITNKELNAVKLSPTKKYFYQIGNELLDTTRDDSDGGNACLLIG